MTRKPSIQTTVMIGDETEPPEVSHDGGKPDNWPFYIVFGDDRSRVKVMLSYTQADTLQSALSQMLYDYDVSRGTISAD